MELLSKIAIANHFLFCLASAKVQTFFITTKPFSFFFKIFFLAIHLNQQINHYISINYSKKKYFNFISHFYPFYQTSGENSLLSEIGMK